MNTLFFRLSFILLATVVLTSSVYADTLVLTNIGAMDTQGKKFNQWWYEPQQVVLKGVGSKGANIDITVDGAFQTIHSSVDTGQWSYNLGSLSIADHSITVSSGTESYSFILTIGSSPPPSANSTKGGLPQTGNILPIIGVISVAGALIYVGFKKSEN